jgi:small GTP-binding protein
LKLDQHIETIPTIGLNVENITYKNITMNVFDCGGQERIRALWRHHFQDVNAVIFVVDSTAKDRFNEAKHALEAVLNDARMEGVSLLVFANKQDLQKAATPAEVAQAMNLSAYTSKRKWHVQGSCAVNGVGLFEGLDWLSVNLTPS